ncbi:Dehydroquinate synthase-like protein [Macroventuria anomochaeta]|uniref:Dehydroquinate synthase-like protein n=1 Tax=Macroventuria anomochaeta TaxID=301207 RepID=A0ACB6SBZ3_9PLEO|nr:Dehydroquinate synthase-like protein [Macroventuria anomochaeta]KAF2630622.1 Dehydroquinate synthase-like protein [Macroventuria anomochaeta]
MPFAKHVQQTYNASKIFVIASGSLSQSTDKLDLLVNALGKDKIVGVQKGMASHSPWSEILSVTNPARSKDADCIVTLGAGSLTDAAKLRTPSQLATNVLGSPNPPATITRPTIPLITMPTTLSCGEYFALASGINDATQLKIGFVHSGMGLNLVILDPSLCLTTPVYHWLSTGVRSFLA